MKKLMFAAAAIAAGVAVADVQSANIVGYQTKSVAETGLWTLGSGFLTTGTTTDSFNIQSLIPSFPEEAEDPLGNDEAQIQQLLPGGSIGIIYYYRLTGNVAKGFDGPGWYTVDEKTGNMTKSDKTFVRGEGFLYYAPDPWIDGPDGEIYPPSKLQSSGEVNLDAKTIRIAETGVWALSPDRATSLDIQKIVPTFPEEAEDPLGNDEAQIQELLPGGSIGVIYYYRLTGNVAKGFNGPGWYTVDEKTGNMTKSDKAIGAGEGIFYYAPDPYMIGDDDEDVYLPSYLTFQE